MVHIGNKPFAGSTTIDIPIKLLCFPRGKLTNRKFEETHMHDKCVKYIKSTIGEHLEQWFKVEELTVYDNNKLDEGVLSVMKDYTVLVNFASYVGADEEYSVFEENQDDAVIAALEEAKSDLTIESIEQTDENEYEVEVGFAGFVGVSEFYTVYADSEDAAEDAAIEEAYDDLSVSEINGVSVDDFKDDTPITEDYNDDYVEEDGDPSVIRVIADLAVESGYNDVTIANSVLDNISGFITKEFKNRVVPLDLTYSYNDVQNDYATDDIKRALGLTEHYYNASKISNNERYED